MQDTSKDEGLLDKEKKKKIYQMDHKNIVAEDVAEEDLLDVKDEQKPDF